MARNFGAEALVAKQVHRALRRYAALPTSEREGLVRYASSLAIDLPADAEGRPLELLAALARLGEWEPVGGRVAPKELGEAYLQIPVEEGHRLAGDIVHIWKTDQEAYLEPDWRLEGSTTGFSAVRDPLMHLACLAPGSLRGWHEALIEAGMFYPHELYRDADATARDHLIRLLEAPPHNRDALPPLAWIGDAVVQAAFHRWRQSPPTWDPDVGWRIDEYLRRDAGWELTETGGRRDLFHQECFQLVPVGDPLAAPPGPQDLVQPSLFQDLPPLIPTGPVGVITPHEQTCRWCEQRLVTLFDLDLRDPRLTFVAPGWRRIAMCNRCTLFGTILTEVDGEGGSQWSRLNVHPGYIGREDHGWNLPQRRLVLGPRRRSPLEARVPDLVRGGSQVGGYPTWEQGNSHPLCPKCGRWMVFAGQVMTDEVLGEGEGTTYAFLCQDCGMAATSYEQT